MGEDGDEEGAERWPAWLRPLLSTRFFQPCRRHLDSSKSECNMYCLDCAGDALCSLCLAHHRDHRAVQIRRSSYHDVIRVSEIQKVLDISGVQTYIINSARVVFINERPQPRHGKGVTNNCEVCDRTLLDTFRFCSLGCKLAGSSGEFSPGSKKMVRKKRSRSRRTEAASTDSEEGSSSTSTVSRLSTQPAFTPSTPPARAQSLGYRTGRRRKGVPHRAPLSSLMVEL